ncbi:ubiquitin protein ligase E3A isoform X2 [Musca autumnalis]|uniref:ubiquitin protein ligase E3A isoform X2 n=1 Tax=Musca autumnalis TaxID=221902 RepID=UPI003CE9B5B7
MNDENKLKLPRAAEENGQLIEQEDHPMSDDEETISVPQDLSLGGQRPTATTTTQANQAEQTTPARSATTTSSTTTTTHTSPTPTDMKRSAVKELIERYFYQLQRGCGNPKCSNVNCASSGKVAPMTPNEIAAKAISLFSQDAPLCDHYAQQPKVPRTGPQHDSPSSSRSATVDMECSGPDAASTSGSSSSSSSNSTITSGSSSSSSSSSTGSSNTNILGEIESPNTSKAKPASPPTTPTLENVEYLNEQILDELIEECTKYNSYDRLIHAINQVYCSVKKLSKSFKRPPLVKLASTTANASKLQEILGKSPQELKKEDLRTLEGEHDKDEDSTCIDADDGDDDDGEDNGGGGTGGGDSDDIRPASATSNSMEIGVDHSSSSNAGADGVSVGPSGEGIEPMDEDDVSVDLDDIVVLTQSCDTQVDLESLRRVKKKLYGLNNNAVGEALNNNIILLAESIKYGRFYDWEKILHCFVICFDMATTTSNRFADLEYLERSMPKLCQAAQTMPIKAQARLARIWSVHCKDQLQSFVQCCQQLITLQVIMDEDTVQENSDVIAVTKVLKIAFYASLLAGEIDSYSRTSAASASDADKDSSEDQDGASGSGGGDDGMFVYFPYYSFSEDNLEKELSISCMDCRIPLVPFEEFYNEPLSDAIQMDRDYLSYKNLSLDPMGNHFSFMLYSFILTPATKVIALYYDSRIRMYSERNSSLYSLFSYLGDVNDVVRPDLKLKVRRDNIVNDALIGLELVAMSNPKDLKKQLVVEFVGEQGIDEGGVSKEFFQLIVEEIFNPDFGMFVHQEETNTMWFNPSAFENGAQFALIGIIIGLAIYNNIILAVNFPMVVYRKLMGGRGSFYDLKDWNPTLYRSLKSMLDYQESDMEEVFMQTFKISYKNVFDEVVEHELKPGGGDIAVGQHNKKEFVDLYSDFLLNTSVEKQFKAFKKGFDMVTDESPLQLLFRPEEIELLVCGSRKFDFVELEKSTEYEGGYTKDTQIIKDFWSIVHSLPEESKRKLLEFTTGSDRVPVGGLSRLKLLITRHGPDSDRLPTSHTCFNVLLLPEYSSKEKLEERLLKAINYSKGFGML